MEDESISLSFSFSSGDALDAPDDDGPEPMILDSPPVAQQQRSSGYEPVDLDKEGSSGYEPVDLVEEEPPPTLRRDREQPQPAAETMAAKKARTDEAIARGTAASKKLPVATSAPVLNKVNVNDNDDEDNDDDEPIVHSVADKQRRYRAPLPAKPECDIEDDDDFQQRKKPTPVAPKEPQAEPEAAPKKPAKASAVAEDASGNPDDNNNNVAPPPAARANTQLKEDDADIGKLFLGTTKKQVETKTWMLGKPTNLATELHRAVKGFEQQRAQESAKTARGRDWCTLVGLNASHVSVAEAALRAKGILLDQLKPYQQAFLDALKEQVRTVHGFSQRVMTAYGMPVRFPLATRLDFDKLNLNDARLLVVCAVLHELSAEELAKKQLAEAARKAQVPGPSDGKVVAVSKPTGTKAEDAKPKVRKTWRSALDSVVGRVFAFSKAAKALNSKVVIESSSSLRRRVSRLVAARLKSKAEEKLLTGDDLFTGKLTWSALSEKQQGDLQASIDALCRKARERPAPDAAAAAAKSAPPVATRVPAPPGASVVADQPASLPPSSDQRSNDAASDASAPKVFEYSVEAIVGVDKTPLFTGNRPVSSRESPDASFKEDLLKNVRAQLVERNLPLKDAALVLKCTVHTQTFLIGRSFFCDAASVLVTVEESQPWEFPEIMVGCKPSKKVPFMVVSEQGAFDQYWIVCKELERRGLLQSWRNILKLVSAHAWFPYQLPEWRVPGDKERGKKGKPKKKNKSQSRTLHADGGHVACVALFGSRSTWKSVKQQRQFVSHWQTNGVECRLGVTNGESKQKGGPRRASKKDAVAFAKVRQLSIESAAAHHPVHVGSGFVDPGMSASDSAFVSSATMTELLGDAQKLKEKEVTVEDVHNKWGDVNLVRSFPSFTISSGLIHNEAQRSVFQKTQKKQLEEYVRTLSPADRKRLNDNGGMSGNVNFARTRFADTAAKCTEFLSCAQLRIAFYRKITFRQQRFANRRAKESIAARSIEAVEHIAQMMDSLSSSSQPPLSSQPSSSSSLQPSLSSQPSSSSSSSQPPLSSQPSSSSSSSLQPPLSSQPSSSSSSKPSSLSSRYQRSKLGPKRDKRRERKKFDRRRKKRKAAPPPSSAPSEVPTAAADTAGGDPCPVAVVVDPASRKIIAINYLTGNWNGRQPWGYRGDNSFPRKDFERIKLKLLTRFSRQKRFLHTGVVVILSQGDEYRTTKQCPAPVHRVTDERVDRGLATTRNDSRLTKSPVWKVLFCKACGAFHARDQTSALGGAMNAEQRHLVETCKEFSACPVVAKGYERQV